MYHGDTFEHQGFTFRVEFEQDDMGAPWKWSDGHGIVSDWTTRDKAPGEWVLCSDRSSKMYYNVQETMKIARKDGWGLSGEARAHIEAKLGRPMTKGEMTAEAVKRDFEHLQDWCNDEWSWVYVKVTMLDSDERETKYFSGIGGVESNAGEYLNELARECADECLSDYREYLTKVLA